MLSIPELPAAYAGGRTVDIQTSAVARVISTMHEHLYDPLSLNEMADIAHYSPYHFNRLFRKVTGIPPNHFLYALRLNQAKRLLAETDLNVTEICFEVGYNSLGSFTSRFHQLIGLSPRAFRGLARQGWEASPRDIGALSRANGPADRSQGGISGTVATDPGFDGVILVGLYDRAIPEGSPARCAVLRGTNRYALPVTPDGTYHLFAIGVPWDSDAADLLYLDGLPRGQGGPVTLVGGRISGRTGIALRNRDRTQPPILSCLAALVVRRLATLEVSETVDA